MRLGTTDTNVPVDRGANSIGPVLDVEDVGTVPLDDDLDVDENVGYGVIDTGRPGGRREDDVNVTPREGEIGVGEFALVWCVSRVDFGAQAETTRGEAKHLGCRARAVYRGMDALGANVPSETADDGRLVIFCRELGTAAPRHGAQLRSQLG